MNPLTGVNLVELSEERAKNQALTEQLNQSKKDYLELTDKVLKLEQQL